MTSYKFKLYANEFLTVLNAVGTLVILILLVNLVYKLNTRLRTAHSETAQAVSQVQETQRQQLKVQQCWFELFGQDRTATVTKDQIEACVKGTPFDTKDDSQKTSGSGASNAGSSDLGSRNSDSSTLNVATVQPAAVLPAKQSIDAPSQSQPTTSAPPPNPNPTQPVTPPGGTAGQQPAALLQGALQLNTPLLHDLMVKLSL